MLKLGKQEYITFLFINKQRITKRRAGPGSKADGELRVWMPQSVGIAALYAPQICLFRGVSGLQAGGVGTARAEACGRNTSDVSEEQQGQRESLVTPSLMGPCKYLLLVRVGMEATLRRPEETGSDLCFKRMTLDTVSRINCMGQSRSWGLVGGFCNGAGER